MVKCIPREQLTHFHPEDAHQGLARIRSRHLESYQTKNGEARWWFQIFSIFTLIWRIFPIWLKFSDSLKPPTREGVMWGLPSWELSHMPKLFQRFWVDHISWFFPFGGICDGFVGGYSGWISSTLVGDLKKRAGSWALMNPRRHGCVFDEVT